MVFLTGFVYEGIKFGWNGGRLYRLSYQSTRYFVMREIKPSNKKGGTTVYNIRGKQFTRGRLLEEKTIEVNWSVKNIM